MRGDFASNVAFIPWQQLPHALPPTADRVPTHQPPQRTDLAADYSFSWWEGLITIPRRLPPSASAVPNAQPSQRFDPAQSFDSLWWEIILTLQIHVSAARQNTFQPPQRQEHPVDIAYSWWERFPFWELPIIQPHPLPPSASIVPSAQPSQRHDAPPDYSFLWWERITPHALPKADSVPRGTSALQRYEPLPDLNQSWEIYSRVVLPPSASVVPTRQYPQRTDQPADNAFSWWESIVLAARVLPPPVPIQRGPLSQRYDATQELNQSVWQPLRFTLPPSASTVPTSQPSQRFDPIPDYSFVWWTSVVAVHALPPTASRVPTAQPPQRSDQPQDFHAQWYRPEVRTRLLSPSASPLIARVQWPQRFDSLPDLNHLWWEMVLVNHPPVPGQFIRPLPYHFESLNVFVAGFDVLRILQ